MISFWMSGTRRAGTSMPRSPRATMSASDAATIAGEVIERDRGLDLRDELRDRSAHARGGARTRSTSSGRRTNESPTKSALMPRRHPQCARRRRR